MSYLFISFFRVGGFCKDTDAQSILNPIQSKMKSVNTPIHQLSLPVFFSLY